MSNARFYRRLLLGALVASLTTPVAATPSLPQSKAPAAKAAKAAPAPAAAPLPPPALQVALIQSAIASLNQANLADDYSVLFKNASTSFRSVNTTAQLSQQFKAFRDRGIDLSGDLLLMPQPTQAPTFVGGVLHLVGVLPSQPMATSYDLLFEPEGGRFRLAGISIGLRPAPQPQPQQGSPAASPAQGK